MRPSNLRHEIFPSPSPSPSPPSSPHPPPTTSPRRKPHCTHHPILSPPELDWLIRDFVESGKHFNFVIDSQTRAHWGQLAVRFNAEFATRCGGRERRFNELKCAMVRDEEAFLVAFKKGYDEWRKEREGEGVAVGAESGEEKVGAEGGEEKVREKGGAEGVA